MSDTPTTPPAAPPATPPAPPAPTPPGGDGGGTEPTFSQADLDKYAGRRAAEAKREAERTLAEQLGVTPAEAKKIIEKHQADQEAAKTDVERAKEAQAAAEARAAEAEAKSTQQAFEGRVKDHLVTAGAIAGFDLSDADQSAQAMKRLARARMLLDLPAESTDEEIAAKVAEIKTDVPGLFGTQVPAPAGGQPATVPSGVTPGKPPAGGQQTATGLEAGKQRAAATKPTGDAANPFARWATPA